MSALTWTEVRAPARRPQPPRLVLVPTGPEVRVGGRSRLRITRLGRLVVTSTVALVAAAVLVVALWPAPTSAAPVEVVSTVTVAPGQTLSEVARTQLPGVPVESAVARIQIANHLPSAQLRAGQTLVIPRS